VNRWNVVHFSEAYWRTLDETVVLESEMAKENSGNDCVGHCRCHLPSEYADEDDVFQD
jgi:hypothetical protein